VVVGKPFAVQDNRTTALLAGSVTALTTLGIWDHCAERAAPLRVIRIVDDTGRLWRAPEVTFDAQEIALDAFGHNIENRQLVAALDRRARELSSLRIIDGEVLGITADESYTTVSLKTKETLAAQLIVGADGRHSLCREAAGIGFNEDKYPQVALTLCFRHSRPHRDTSTEFHTPTGPFTLVPLPGNRSSLVWVLDPADADDLDALNDVELASAVERMSHSILGKIEVEPGRGLFPLTRASATRFAANRIVLVGEAAHVIPPIGAQGLNLGLRDAAAIGEIAVEAQRAGRDVGAINTVVAYDKMRRTDVGTRSFAVDMLNRSLLSDFLPLQGVRGLGLYALDRIGPLRRLLMREGVAPRTAQPKLMRGEAL